ncbi:MAG: FAD-dependent monooxygenase [Pseudomonadota bacterium]
MKTASDADRPRAVVIGGSLGGLFAATMLKTAGWSVEVFERSRHDLDSRGGGIVLQPSVMSLFRKIGVTLPLSALGVRSATRIVYAPDGSLISHQPVSQTQTSWSLIYTTLKSAFGETHYHRGQTLVDLSQDDARGLVTASFAEGSKVTGDLLIGADGNGSTVRSLLWPGAEPSYAGYFAWRGLLPEADMPDRARADLHGDFAFASNQGSHMLGYLVPGPGNDVRPGHRLYNWVWYRTADAEQLQRIMTDATGRSRGFSLPEGTLAPASKELLRADAARLLPPGFRDAVLATEEPFAQAIRDLTVSCMVKGRILLLGDAASIPRPHTAASTAKAAANALALAEALTQFPEDLSAALSAWEPAQLEVAARLDQQGRAAGQQLLFSRSS